MEGGGASVILLHFSSVTGRSKIKPGFHIIQTFAKSFARFLPVLVRPCLVPSALRSSLAPSALDRFGIFGLFLGFLPFSNFYRAYLSCHYQKY